MAAKMAHRNRPPQAAAKYFAPWGPICAVAMAAIPLAYEMARIGCRNYVVARKGIKAYMEDPIHVQVKSITTD